METGRPTRLTGGRAMELDGTEQSLIVESFQGSGVAPRNHRFRGCQTWHQWSVAAWLGRSFSSLLISSTKGRNLVKHWHLPGCLCHPSIRTNPTRPSLSSHLTPVLCPGPVRTPHPTLPRGWTAVPQPRTQRFDGDFGTLSGWRFTVNRCIPIRFPKEAFIPLLFRL